MLSGPTVDSLAGRRVRGHLRLICERRADGSSYLSERSYQPPIHISKPYWSGSSLLLNVMSPTAGLFAGDTMEIAARVRFGASLTLSSPSALRIHKMRSGSASLTQRFAIESGAFLELNPEWMIPQGESSFEQETNIDVAKGGELLYIEAIAPGRAAHGETFAFTRLANRLTLRYGGTLSALERYEIEPAQRGHAAWMAAFETPFAISLLVASPKLEGPNPVWEAIHSLGNSTSRLEVGTSRLASGPCWSVKLIAADPADARTALVQIRSLVYAAIERVPADLRR